MSLSSNLAMILGDMFALTLRLLVAPGSLLLNGLGMCSLACGAPQHLDSRVIHTEGAHYGSTCC